MRNLMILRLLLLFLLVIVMVVMEGQLFCNLELAPFVVVIQ